MNKDLEREGAIQGLGGGKAKAPIGDLKADIKKIQLSGFVDSQVQINRANRLVEGINELSIKK